MAVLSRIAAGLFVVALPLFLITANIRFFAGETRFYERGFRDHNAENTTGIPLAELDRAASEIVNYFEDDASELRIIVAQDGQEVSLFNARETSHMRDVKTLMRAIYRLNEFTLAYILTYVTAVFLWSRERSLRTLAYQAITGVGVGLGMVAAVGVLTVTGFDAAWTRFHELVFRNDLWKLDPSRDHLIQMFPEGFWRDATYLIGIITAGEAVLILAVAAAYLVFTREADAPIAERAPEAATPRAV